MSGIYQVYTMIINFLGFPDGLDSTPGRKAEQNGLPLPHYLSEFRGSDD